MSTIFHLCNFLKSKKPPAKIKGSITGALTHQVAACSGDSNEIPTTDAATGLNKWRFSIVNKYLAPIATTPAPIKNIKFTGSLVGIIKVKIKAVMYTDSTLVTALNIFAKT